MLSMELIHIGAGALVGLIIGLTGVGGGSLMTPILVLGFSIQPSIAVGTDLLYAAITKSSGVFFHQKNKTVDWKIVALLSSGSIPSSISTIYFLEYIRSLDINYDSIIITTLGFMLILTSLSALTPGKSLQIFSIRIISWKFCFKESSCFKSCFPKNRAMFQRRGSVGCD